MQRPVAGDTGIVDHCIDRADFLSDFGAAFEARLVIAYVPLICLDARLGGEVARGLVIAAVIGDDFETAVAKMLDNRATDTAGSAGDNCYS